MLLPSLLDVTVIHCHLQDTYLDPVEWIQQWIIWRFIGHFFANDLGLNIYIFEWSFFWRLQYHCHWSRPCFLNGTRSFLLNRTVVCSEECLAATSRAHSLSMSKPITTLRTESGAFCWSPPFLCTVYFHIFPPFPRIPSEKRETARHHNIALFFVIDIPKKIANHLGFSPGSQVSRRDIAQVLAKKQVPTVPMDQQRSIPGGTRQLARMELRQCLPPWFLHIRCSPWSWCVLLAPFLGPPYSYRRTSLMHACMHYITLHDMTWHYITLH